MLRHNLTATVNDDVEIFLAIKVLVVRQTELSAVVRYEFIFVIATYFSEQLFVFANFSELVERLASGWVRRWVLDSC